MKKYFSILLLLSVSVFADVHFSQTNFSAFCGRAKCGDNFQDLDECKAFIKPLEESAPNTTHKCRQETYAEYFEPEPDPEPPVDPPVEDPPTLPPMQSQWRGVPDPSQALGFDVFADYPATQTLTGPQGKKTITCNGSAQAPCLIDATEATFTTVILSGSHIILQGGRVNAPSTDGSFVRLCSFCVVRDLVASGPGTDHGSDSVVGMANNSVWIRGEVFGFGDNRAEAKENDFHGFKVMGENIWILSAKVFDLAGDSVQVGDASRGASRNVYVAGNLFHSNRENGVDVKDATNVVVSQNIIYGFKRTNSSSGEAVVIHDDAFGVKVYDNKISDTVLGIVTSGLRDHQIIDNEIDAIRTGIECRNTQNLTVRGNTITAPTPFERQSNCDGDLQF